MNVPRRRTRVALLSAALLVPTTLLFGVPAASAAPALTAVDGTLPRWMAQTRTLRSAASPAAAAKKMAVKVYLTPRGGQAGLVARVAAVSDPASPDYGKFLSSAAFTQTYAPTRGSASSVRRYLEAQGLKVTGVEAHRRYVSAEGTVAQLDRAFHVSLQNYRHDDQQVVAPAAAAELPANVARHVLTVSGLDTTTTRMTHRQTPKATPPPGFLNARPCNTVYGALAAKYQADFSTPLPTFDGKVLPYAPCGYTGPLLRAGYEGDTKLTGKGVTVAITDAYAWQLLAKDTNRYAEEHGDGSYVSGQLTQSLPTSYRDQKLCDPSGWAGEEVLDVEAVHAMAPDARIRYYGASSCQDEDLLDAIGRVVDENVASVVTNSWGDAGEVTTADSVMAYNQVVLQGALQGISFLWSSGDSGDELANTGVKTADFPATLPYATAVGGTATGLDGSTTRVFDAGWGTQKYNLSADGKSWTPVGFLYGAGGGYSTLFNQPAYQKGVVPASAPPGRAVPDIAMDADPNTGMLIGITQTFKDSVHYGEYRIGGTSLASPLLAGMTALAVQKNGGKGLGSLNAAIYAKTSVADDVTKKPNRPGVVRADYTDGADPTSKVIYSVRTFGQDSSLEVVKGWDPVTGIGVPNSSYFDLGPASAKAAAKR